MKSLPYSIRCLGFAALVCAGQASHAQSSADLYAGVTTVEVFANMAMQVSSNPNAHYKMSVYRLDAMQGIEAIANKGLPQNEAEAGARLHRLTVAREISRGRDAPGQEIQD